MSKRRRPVTRSERPPKPGLWFAPPQPLRRTQKKIPEPLQALVWIPLMICQVCGFVGHSVPDWIFGVLVLGLAALILTAIAWRILESLALRAKPEDRAFSDAPPGLIEYPVEVTIHNSEGALGFDRGFVWFEDGVITFNGRSCSFALESQDFIRRNEEGGREIYRKLPGDALRLRLPGEFAYIRLSPLSLGNPFAFGLSLGRFLTSVSTSDRPRQWPPLTAYGSVPGSDAPILTTPREIGVEAARSGIGFGVIPNVPLSE